MTVKLLFSKPRVIVGADNVPTDGTHFRRDTCGLFNPGPFPHGPAE